MWKPAPLSIIMHDNVIYSYEVVIIISNPYLKIRKWLNKSWKLFGEVVWEACDLMNDYMPNLVIL